MIQHLYVSCYYYRKTFQNRLTRIISEKRLPLLTHTLSYIIHLLMTFKLQMSAPPDRVSELHHSMQSCIGDVKVWATANMLRLNDSKTELMLVTSMRSKHLHKPPTSITISNAQIPFKQSVKNLGFTLDCHLTMNAMSPILLGHATLNCVVWHLFVDS